MLPSVPFGEIVLLVGLILVGGLVTGILAGLFGIGGGALAGCSPGDSVALAVWGFSLSLIANSFQGRRQSVFRRASAAKKIYFLWSTKS